MVERGRPIVVSAPSGTGKSTVCQLLRRRHPRVAVSISYTTRPPRAGEQDGQEYHFVDDTTFSALVERGCFLEWAQVHDQRYGTNRAEVERLLDQGHDVLFDIDIQGGLQIKRQLPEAVLVFLLPPSLEELLRRLRGRGTESEAQIHRRLRTAREELELCRRYDWLVVNDDLQQTLAAVDALRQGRSLTGPQPLPLLEQLRRDIGEFLNKLHEAS